MSKRQKYSTYSTIIVENSSDSFRFYTLRRSHPAKHGEGFDAPPTIERSGSEHRRAVTSLIPMVGI